MPDQNSIYNFMKSNNLTDLDEKTFTNKYSSPDKAKEIYSFMASNKLTDLDESKFYDKYLKKKVGGDELSLTKSPSISQEYLKEGQQLADKGFIKTEKLDPSQLVSQYKSPDITLFPKPKKDYYSSKLEKGLIFDKEGKLFAPSSEALTKEITKAQEASLKKPTQKDLVEKSREVVVEEEPVPMEKQGWLLNTVSALDKGFAKNFISSPIKGLGTILQGATKKVMGGTGEGFVSDKLIQFGDYLNNAIDELTPQDEEFKGTLTDQVAQAFGQVGSLIATGGLTGAAGKGAALVSQVPKGAVATAAKTLGSQLSSPSAVSAGLSMGQAEFDRAKEAGATDDQAFEAFYKNALTGSVLETIPVMQFFKRFNNSTGGSVANYIKTKGVAGLTGGIEEMTTEVMQQLYANKTAKDIYNINQDILDGVGSSGGVGFGVGFLLNAMGANAKILRKEGREKEATVLENQVKQYEDNLENPKVTSGNKVSAKDIVTQGVEIGTQKAVKNLDRDLANNVITPEQYQEGIVFAQKAAQVADKIPVTVTGESRAKSIELLVERNDIKEANQNLLQQKQATDEAYHAGIDEEIKANEERIKKIDSEVYNITKKPSKEFGTKKYVVDGEEVSKEAFEALQDKPLGTKTVIKAEVKPEEVEVIEEVKPAEVKISSTEFFNRPVNGKIYKTNKTSAESNWGIKSINGEYIVDEAVGDNSEIIKRPESLVKPLFDEANVSSPDDKIFVTKPAKLRKNSDGTFDVIEKGEIYYGKEAPKSEVKPTEVKETIKIQEDAIQEPIASSVLQPTQEGVGEAGGERKRVEQGVEGQKAAQKGKQVKGDEKVIAKKTYQEAVKEKLEADKKKNRETGAERAKVTKELYRRVSQMDAPADAEQIALKYFADGGKVSKEAVDEAYGSVKRAELNVKRRASLSEEVKSKDFVQGNETLDDLAHRLWEANDQKIPEDKIKEKLMAEIGSNNTRSEAAEAYLDRYSAEYKLEKQEMRLAEQYEEEYLEEQKKLEEELRNPLDEQIEGEASEEHINNLIKQYEAEFKAEDQQLRPESEGDVSKEAGKRKVAEKAPETELATQYKEVIGKASKKAKENAKKDFVDRNFDSIVEKLKIQIKCPT